MSACDGPTLSGDSMGRGARVNQGWGPRSPGPGRAPPSRRPLPRARPAPTWVQGRLLVTTDTCDLLELGGMGSATCVLPSPDDPDAGEPGPGEPSAESSVFGVSVAGAELGYLVRGREGRQVWRTAGEAGCLRRGLGAVL